MYNSYISLLEFCKEKKNLQCNKHESRDLHDTVNQVTSTVFKRCASKNFSSITKVENITPSICQT